MAAILGATARPIWSILGVRLDAGYQLALGGGYFVEPQVMLAAVNSRSTTSTSLAAGRL